MKKIIYISTVLFFSSMLSLSAQDVASITVKCPPCKPIQGCNQCYETQAEADLACGSSSSRLGSIDLEEELTALDLTVFPNPSKIGKFNIESFKALNGAIRLYTPTGQLLEEFVVKNKKNFTLGKALSLPSGIYIMTYTNDKGTNISKRLVVDKK